MRAELLSTTRRPDGRVAAVGRAAGPPVRGGGGGVGAVDEHYTRDDESGRLRLNGPRRATPVRRQSQTQPVGPTGSGYHAGKWETGSLISKEGMLARVNKLTVAMTKTQLLSDIAENTALTRRQVADVFEALDSVIERHVQKGAVGTCTIPGLMKIKVVKKPAQRARKNVPNPFRPGETMDVKAKPASTSVKVLPLKKLKDMA